MSKGKTLREYMNAARAKEVRAWAVAVMNAATLIAVQASTAGCYDAETGEAFDRCCDELLFSFEQMPEKKEESAHE